MRYTLHARATVHRHGMQRAAGTCIARAASPAASLTGTCWRTPAIPQHGMMHRGRRPTGRHHPYRLIHPMCNFQGGQPGSVLALSRVCQDEWTADMPWLVLTSQSPVAQIRTGDDLFTLSD